VQTSIFICGLSILALTSVEGYNGYVIFVWVYGIFLGSLSSPIYCTKICTMYILFLIYYI
jgi:hypothetical protein